MNISFTEILSTLNTLSQEALALLLNNIKQNTSSVASANTLTPFQSTLSSGDLTKGRYYEILVNTGADFTTVGSADNNVGTQFKAILANLTPTWGTGSLAVAEWDGATITISGTTTINTISKKFLNYGDRIRLVFAGALQLTDSAGTSSDDCELVLGSNVTTSASGDIELQLRSDDKWYPVGGSLNPNSVTLQSVIDVTGYGFYDTTVGDSAIAGEDGAYTTVKAAIDAGKYKLKLVGSTLEVADIILSNSDNIEIKGNSKDYAINFQTYKFITGNDCSIKFDNLSFYYSVDFFVNNSHDVVLSNCNIYDKNASAAINLATSSKTLVSNCNWIIEKTSTAIGGTATNNSIIIENTVIDSQNANSQFAIGFKGTSIEFTGDWDSIAIYNTLNDCDFTNSTISNYISIYTSNAVSQFKIYAPTHKISLGSDVHITEFYANEIRPGGVFDCVLTNGKINSFSNIGGIDDYTFDKCQFPNAVTLSSGVNGANFDQCFFLDNVICSSGSNDNVFNNCKFGTNLAAGKNLNINAGANGTHAVGNKSGIAIVDAGTGSQIAVNSLFNV